MKSIFLLLTFICFSFTTQSQVINNTRNSAILSGKILHYDKNIPLTAHIQQIGLGSIPVKIEVDSTGNFYQNVPVNYSTEAYIIYKTSFIILIQPQDTLNFILDGSTNSISKVLESIQFKGNRAETNQGITFFQKMYFSNDKRNKLSSERLAAAKNLDAAKYKEYLQDESRIENLIYEDFINNIQPNEESKQWVHTSITNEYYNRLSRYARDHANENRLSPFDTTWTIPPFYYTQLKDRLPITSADLKNVQSLNSFASGYKHYVVESLSKEAKPSDKWQRLPGGNLFAPSEIIDSLMVMKILKFVPDTLLRQIMLTQSLNNSLENQNIEPYENMYAIVDKYITLPFLKIPLHALYIETKARIENPKLYSEAVLKEALSSEVKEIFNEILANNKGKVVYMDVWATWCGPCLEQMPNSKKLEKNFKDKNVSFVYLCVNSDKAKYLATLDKLQLGGQHYFLTNQQSRDLFKMFDMPGIPYYILVDKEGTIKEQGNHLRPDMMYSKFQNMEL